MLGGAAAGDRQALVPARSAAVHASSAHADPVRSGFRRDGCFANVPRRADLCAQAGQEGFQQHGVAGWRAGRAGRRWRAALSLAGTVEVETAGEREQEAMDALLALIADKFGEGE